MELKPCPFCGREAVLSSIHIGDGDYRAMVTCTRIGPSDCCASVIVERSSRRTAERDAAEKWNTRVERTCQRVLYKPTGVLVCSECGAGIPTQLDKYCYLHYCPNCGAKVVDE